MPTVATRKSSYTSQSLSPTSHLTAFHCLYAKFKSFIYYKHQLHLTFLVQSPYNTNLSILEIERPYCNYLKKASMQNDTLTVVRSSRPTKRKNIAIQIYQFASILLSLTAINLSDIQSSTQTTYRKYIKQTFICVTHIIKQ